MEQHNDLPMIKLIIIKLIKNYINYVLKELLKNWLIGKSLSILLLGDRYAVSFILRIAFWYEERIEACGDESCSS